MSPRQTEFCRRAVHSDRRKPGQTALFEERVNEGGEAHRAREFALVSSEARWTCIVTSDSEPTQ